MNTWVPNFFAMCCTVSLIYSWDSAILLGLPPLLSDSRQLDPGVNQMCLRNRKTSRKKVISRKNGSYFTLSFVEGARDPLPQNGPIKAIETKSTTSRQYVFLLRFTSKVTSVQLSTGFIYCPAKRVLVLPSVSMFHVELTPLGGILGPLKSDLGVFWAKIPLHPYNVKTQKTHFLKIPLKPDFELLDS